MKSKKSSSRFTGSSDILHNKYVLYASFFFAIVTAAGYLLSNNLEAICIFVLIGFLTTYFSKNMIVVLLVTTVATNFVVMMRNKNGSLIEGLTTEEENKKKEEAAAAAAAAAGPDTKVGPGVTGKTLDVPPKPAGSVIPQASDNATGDASPVSTANGNIKSNKNITEYLSNLSPAPVGSEGNSMLDLQKGLASGYGDQKEQMYKALASLGGAGAAGTTSKMSSDTLNQQTEMINNLKSIQPILDTAEKFLDKFENSSISKLFSSAGSIPGMSLLTGGLGKTSSPVGAQA
jgi:hypothetical protein